MRTLLSTDDGQHGDSFKRWNEAVVERIAPAELTRLGDRPFRGTLEGMGVGSLWITRVTQSPIRIVETPTTIRRHAEDDTLTVGITLEGIVNTSQNGRDAVARVGEIVVLDRRPSIIEMRADSRTLVLDVPRAKLESMLGPAQVYASLTVGVGQASTTLVTTFFNELIRVHRSLPPDTAARMASIGTDLLVASIAERLAKEPPKLLHGTIVVQRAKAYIEANLCDPKLDLPYLAAAVGVSVRRLQELFHEQGRYVSDWIWQRRLEVAAVRLADPGYDHLSLGMLGHGCGFATPGHFSRRFKDRYGMTPRDYRQRARQNILAAGAGGKAALLRD